MLKLLNSLFSSRKPQPQIRASRQSCKPQLEALEARNLMANYLVLDYTPDAIAGESVQRLPFSQAFRMTYQDGTPPAFLNMDGNNVVDYRDTEIAARSISNRVSQLLSTFQYNNGQPAIQVVWGDLWRNDQLGLNRLNAGIRSSTDQVFTMYVGGWANERLVLGEAYQAPVGYNNEYYGHAYTSEQVHSLMNRRGATAQEFINKQAKTIVHEFGHLIGLGHVKGNPAGDRNIMNYNSDPATAYIPDATYRSIEIHQKNGDSYYGAQNPAAEVARSLAGQPANTSVQNYRYSGSNRASGERLHQEMADGECELHHEGEDHGEEVHEHEEHVQEMIPDAPVPGRLNMDVSLFVSPGTATTRPEASGWNNVIDKVFSQPEGDGSNRRHQEAVNQETQTDPSLAENSRSQKKGAGADPMLFWNSIDSGTLAIDPFLNLL